MSLYIILSVWTKVDVKYVVAKWTSSSSIMSYPNVWVGKLKTSLFVVGPVLVRFTLFTVKKSWQP